jgi:hypothetical protein
MNAYYVEFEAKSEPTEPHSHICAEIIYVKRASSSFA